MTAKEFFDKNADESGVYCDQDICKLMIEFAKFHVELALISATKEVYINRDNDGNYGLINLDSILNAYSFDNIK
jgi:hypothetical protein